MTSEEQIVVKISYNVKKTTTDRQGYVKKSCKCSLYFYSESVTKIILMVINFVLRHIPGKSCSISTCWCMTTWNPSVCSGWPEGADSLGHAARIGVFGLAGGAAEADQPAARVQRASDRLHPGAGAAGAGPRRGRPQVQLRLRLQEGDHPGPHRVSTTCPCYLCHFPSSEQWGWYFFVSVFSGHWMTACTK